MKIMENNELKLKDAKLDANGDEYYLLDYQGRELFLAFCLKSNLFQMTELGKDVVNIPYELFSGAVNKVRFAREKLNIKLLDNVPAN